MGALADLGRLKVKHNKFDRPAVGFGMQVFLSFTESHSPEVQRTLLDLALEFQTRFPAILTHYQKHDATRLTRFDRDACQTYHAGFIDQIDPENDQFSIHILDSDIPPAAAFNVLTGTIPLRRKFPCAGVKAHLPLDWVEADPEVCVALVLDWCNRLKPVKGAVGVAPVTEFGMDRAHYREIWPFLARFPGMLSTGPLYRANRNIHQIGSVGWLTILNDAIVAELGGADDLGATLGPEITVHRWAGGVLIEAGSPDDLGDVNVDRWPEALVRVNAALRPVRFEDYPNTPMALMKVPEPLDPYEETLKWVRRLDRED